MVYKQNLLRRVTKVPVVEKVDSAIGFPNTIHWTVIYPVDSAQLLNNWGQDNITNLTDMFHHA